MKLQKCFTVLMFLVLVLASGKSTTMPVRFYPPIAEMSGQGVILQEIERRSDPQPQSCWCPPFTPPWDCPCQIIK